VSRDRKKDEAQDAFRNRALSDKLAQWKAEAKAQAAKAAPPEPKPPPPPKAARPSKAPARSLEDDDALFRAVMGEVAPVRSKGPVEPRAPEVDLRVVSEEAEALAMLSELVATGEGLELADTDEYVEGAAHGVDPGLLVRLRRGDFSVQAHLDLHGLDREAARTGLEAFLVTSRRRGLRCVLVVHGRGLHSKDQIPVLKERVHAWFSRGRLARMVLAFATARPVDGGAGAMYVLLRR
jgi:DNA-nicking Smr family endonuclease